VVIVPGDRSGSKVTLVEFTTSAGQDGRLSPSLRSGGGLPYKIHPRAPDNGMPSPTAQEGSGPAPLARSALFFDRGLQRNMASAQTTPKPLSPRGPTARPGAEEKRSRTPQSRSHTDDWKKLQGTCIAFVHRLQLANLSTQGAAVADAHQVIDGGRDHKDPVNLQDQPGHLLIPGTKQIRPLGIRSRWPGIRLQFLCGARTVGNNTR